MSLNYRSDTITESIIRNFFFFGGSRFLAPLLSIVLVGYISRTLGVVGLGEYNLIIVTFNIFMVPAHLGLAQFITREIANKRKTISDIYLKFTTLGLVSSILMSIGMVTYAWISRYDLRLIWLFMIAAIGLLPNTLLIYHRAIAAAREKFHIHAILLMTERFARVILGIIFLCAGYALTGLMIGYSFSILLALGVSFFLLREQFRKIRRDVDFSIMGSFLKIAPTFLMISIASTVFWKIDVLMLAKIKGVRDVGLYTAGYRLMEIAFMFLLSFTTIVFPVAAKLFHQNKSNFSKFCTTNIKYLLILALPATMIIYVFAEKILVTIYGPELSEATNAFRILILTLVPFGPTMILANALTAGDHQNLDLIAISISMVFNIIANLFFIPHYGYIGAAYSTLISVIFKLVLQMILVFRSLYRPVLSIQFIKPFISAVFMFACLYALDDFSILLRVTIGLIVYLLIILILRTFKKEEIIRIREIRIHSLFEVNK